MDDGIASIDTDRSLHMFARDVMIRAYELARDHYDPDIGVDGQIFAFAVYKIVSHLFQERVDLDLPGGAVVWNGRGRELVRGGRHIRWNKVGSSERDRIDESFPSRSRSAAVMADANVEQLTLGLRDGEPANWILAHVGNPVDGLRALYLAAPIEVRGSQVVGWARWLAIYDVERPDEMLPGAMPVPGSIEPMPAELPDFDLRVRPDEGSAASHA